MNYFRAVLHADERSERALNLTEEVIDLNAASYAAWHFRRLCVEATGRNWKTELDWVNSLASDNPKNYQIWFHRRCCIDKLNDPGQELKWVEDYLTDPELEDAKNYHVWGHRQWVLDRFFLWDQELPFVDRLLELDVRNNSAWNQRFYAVEKTSGWGADGVIQRELDFTLAKIRTVPHNESAWVYLRRYSNLRNVKLHIPQHHAASRLCRSEGIT